MPNIQKPKLLVGVKIPLPKLSWNHQKKNYIPDFLNTPNTYNMQIIYWEYCKNSLISFTQIYDPNQFSYNHHTNIKTKIENIGREGKKKETTDPDGCTELKKSGLRKEDLASVDAELTDLTFRKLDLLSTFTL